MGLLFHSERLPRAPEVFLQYHRLTLCQEHIQHPLRPSTQPSARQISLHPCNCINTHFITFHIAPPVFTILFCRKPAPPARGRRSLPAPSLFEGTFPARLPPHYLCFNHRDPACIVAVGSCSRMQRYGSSASVSKHKLRSCGNPPIGRA